MNTLDQTFLDAVEAQDKSAIESAVQAGADVTATDAGGMNALGIAARHGNLGMADFLASVGVPVTNDALTIAQMTEFDTTPKMILLLQTWQVRQMEPETDKLSEVDAALTIAAATGAQDALTDALAKGAQINVLDGLDTTPLRWAIRKGRVAAALSLIEAGADVNHLSEGGWTPLMEAGASGEEALVQSLLTAGANAAFANSLGQTAESVTRYGGFDTLADTLKLAASHA